MSPNSKRELICFQCSVVLTTCIPPHLSTEMPDCQGNPCLRGFCDEDQCVCYTNYVGEDCSQFQQQGGFNFILFDWNIRTRLHRASVSMLHQLCDDTSNTVLIENNGVASEWGGNPFWSDSIVFIESSMASVIAALLLHWRWRLVWTVP